MVRPGHLSVYSRQKNEKTGKDTAGCEKMKVKKSYIIGFIVVVAALIMVMYSFQSTLTSYVTVKEAKATKRPVQVAGVVAQGSRKFDLQSNNLVFVLREDGGDQMRIEYFGPKPANFDNVTKVVAIGKYNPKKQVFLAKELLVIHPAKTVEL
jgi:cytochrome c-type biogenesis protein CcmE